MNEFEQKLYMRGLENLYGSILLEDPKALEQIECLVRLTRSMGPKSEAPRSLEEIIRFIQDFFEICFPDKALEICRCQNSTKVWMSGRDLAEQLCLQLINLEKKHALPERLSVFCQPPTLYCQLSSGGNILWQGEYDYE